MAITSDIFNFNFTPPSGLKTESFVLFMTDVNFANSDYEAVMNSRESLRIWSQSPWPEDDFTIQQNREDLAHHIQDNLDHSAFGYMIYSPDLTTCYGSVYINPLRSTREGYSIPEDVLQTLDQSHARIDYWTVNGMPQPMQVEILETLKTWFKSEWKIEPIFSARHGMKEREDLYIQAGLRIIADLRGKTSDITLLIFN